jgi:DNA-binding CsgD family transcriptional regulator
MRSLKIVDYRKVLDFIAALGETRDLDSYASVIVSDLYRLIDGSGVGYNEVNMRRRRAHWISDVKTTRADVEAFEAHLHDNPLVNFAARNPGSGAHAVSDLIGRSHWRNKGVYRDFYGPLRLEDMMAVAPFSGDVVIAISVFRERYGFSERDHQMLSLLEPHLAHAYRNAALMDDLSASIALLEGGYDVFQLGAITVDALSRVLNMTSRARALIETYFGAKNDALPEEIQRWLRKTAMPSGTSQTTPDLAPLTVAHGPSRLILRCMRRDGRTLVLLREWRPEPAADDLRTLGLSRRESEMLALATAGKTDRQIAAALSLSARTVNHTMARVYRKLGVTNRAAAVARALAAGEP